ncbi:MAG: hypothetical protein V1860_03905 [bacterium]
MRKGIVVFFILAAIHLMGTRYCDAPIINEVICIIYIEEKMPQEVPEEKFVTPEIEVIYI